MTIAEFNALSDEAAAAELTAVCGSAHWGRLMLARRPFADVDAVRRSAGDSWSILDRCDWTEAATHHPRIGEGAAAQPASARSQEWSKGEQAGARDSDDDTRRHFAELSEMYERKFERTFIICATGLSLPDMVAALAQRLGNNRDAELGVMAEELRCITMLRLDKLFADH